MSDILYKGVQHSLKALREMSPGTRIKFQSCGLSYDGYFAQFTADNIVFLQQGQGLARGTDGFSKVDVSYGIYSLKVIDESQNGQKPTNEHPIHLNF